MTDNKGQDLVKNTINHVDKFTQKVCIVRSSLPLRARIEPGPRHKVDQTYLHRTPECLIHRTKVQLNRFFLKSEVHTPNRTPSIQD